MTSVLWTPRAEAELEDLAFYIAVRDTRPTVALKLIDEIVAKSQQYANRHHRLATKLLPNQPWPYTPKCGFPIQRVRL